MEKTDGSTSDISICLKCGSQISHIPYRYNGQVFHARCLLCNGCGRRLIGKPFITSSRQIFCGDKCQEAFAKGKSPKPPADLSYPEPPVGSVSEEFTPTISLEEVLDSMPGTLTSGSMRSHEPAPAQYHQPSAPPSVARITDYPVSSSSPVSSRSYSLRSEPDSMSTFSESSFTSDSSSYTYDAHRKPKKKILKNSNTPRKSHHKKNVRWNLNNLESVSDADSVSLDSSSSFGSYAPPTAAHMYAHARQVTDRTLQNWRDYERPLPPGSTGLTPTQTKGLPQSHQFLQSPPTARTAYPRHHNGTYLYRTYSGDIPSPSHYYSQSKSGPRHVSLVDLNQPLPNHSPLSSMPTRQEEQQQSSPLKYRLPTHSNGPVLNVPVFHLDEDNLPELEESTAEDRRRLRLYQIPQLPSTNRTLPSRTLQMLTEDDKNDYDHLLPTTIPPPVPPAQKTAQERLAPAKPDDQWYSNEDIEEALQLIDNEDSLSEDEALPTKPKPPPPAVPSKPLKQKKVPPAPPKRVSSLKLPSSSQETRPQLDQPDSLKLPLSLESTKEPPTCLSAPPETSSNALHSPSMETLKNYMSDSSQLEDGLTPEVHPETPTTTSELGFSFEAPLKMKDRIVEGAEDPHRNTSPTHASLVYSMPNPVTRTSDPRVTSTGDLPGSVTGLTETRRNSLSPKTNKGGTAQEPVTVSKLRRVNTSPNDLSTSSELTQEERAMVEWLKQPRKMKPIVVDTDREIEQMMAEMGNGKSPKNRRGLRSSSSLSSSASSLTSTRQKYFGTCSVCNKVIESSQSLFSFASRLYHNKCFCCAQCGCPLRGKQIYTIKGTLVCSDDYNKITSKGSTHSLPSVALKKDSNREPVLFQRVIHSGDHMTLRHNSATMV